MPDLRQRCLTVKPGDDTAPADALVLFGAMGDLAHKKIFPALYHMARHGHLNEPAICIARSGRTETDLKERVRDSIQKLDGNFDQQALAKLFELLRHVGGEGNVKHAIVHRYQEHPQTAANWEEVQRYRGTETPKAQRGTHQ